MTDWNFVGARWWKFDFHAHTPASNDFKQPEMTAEDWLLGYMIAGIDCVAVTDHNSGEWIDKLKDELRDMEESGHFLYRPLHLFPGIEISAQGGVHVLAIFDPSKTSSDIDALRGAVGYKGQPGGTDRETEKSLSQVIDEITAHGGLAIPAHVDKPKGLFRLSGLALQKILEHPGVLAMELCDLDYSKPGAYRSAKTNWAEVCGSDRHDERDSDTFTWVKLGEPSIEGLRLALIDGASSIGRNMSEEPNAHADFVIEEVMINQAKFMGRPDKLVIRFSPFLTSIVGGRGTGKSTIVEFLRLALRRREELPDTLRTAMPNYFGAGEDGLLTPNASIHIIYRKGDVRYRLSWNEQEEDLPSLEEEDIETATWEEVDGEISSLFPVSIFSQKQIFELASNPQGLLGIIDSEPQVEADSYASRYRDSVNQCKQVAREITRLRGKIAQERELVGKLNDLKRRIRQLQASGHKEALQTYRLRQQQVGEIRQVSEHWSDTFAELAKALDDVGLIEVNRDAFEHHPEILDELEEYQQSALGKIRQIQDILTQAASRPLEWRPDAARGEWWDSLRNDVRTFRKLRDALEEQGLDPKMYEDLLQSHASIEREIQEIGSLKDRTGVLQTEYRNKLRQARKDREELTAAREAFLKGILQGSTEVKIKIRPFEQQWGGVQADVRRLLQAENRFNRDFDALSEVFFEPWLGRDQKSGERN